MPRHLVILTGAGMSADSGIATFRAKDGLWENHRVEDVASPEGWKRNRELVLRFYHERRRDIRAAQPNAGHRACAELERAFRVSIVTQNIDDLHERAGSTEIVHLHGEILKAQSTLDPRLVVDLAGGDLEEGMRCPKGSQLRPFIVWFGESVPLINHAAALVAGADLLLVVGTSLQVYPAAGLLAFARPEAPIILLDPSAATLPLSAVTARPGEVRLIAQRAAEGLPELAEELLRAEGK